METCELHSKAVVVYENQYMPCPLCDAEEQIKELEKENSEQSDRIDKLEDHIEELKEQLADLLAEGRKE